MDETLTDKVFCLLEGFSFSITSKPIKKCFCHQEVIPFYRNVTKTRNLFTLSTHFGPVAIKLKLAYILRIFVDDDVFQFVLFLSCSVYQAITKGLETIRHLLLQHL